MWGPTHLGGFVSPPGSPRLCRIRADALSGLAPSGVRHPYTNARVRFLVDASLVFPGWLSGLVWSCFLSLDSVDNDPTLHTTDQRRCRFVLFGRAGTVPTVYKLSTPCGWSIDRLLDGPYVGLTRRSCNRAVSVCGHHRHNRGCADAFGPGLRE